MIFSKTRIRTDDSDEFRTWEAEIGVAAQRIQLSQGPGVYQADVVQLGELDLWRYHESQHILTDFSLPPGAVELCLALCPDRPVWCGTEIPVSTAAIHVGMRSYRTILPPGSIAYGVVFRDSSRLFADHFSDEQLTRISKRTSATSLIPTRLRKRLFPILDAIVESHSEPSVAIAHDSLVSCCHEILDTCFAGEVFPTLPKKRLVDDAIDLIARRLDTELQVGDLAVSLDVPRRELERAFRRHLGVSPLQYLLANRLEHARSLLNRSEASVLEVCLRCGFNHPSRFAKMYSRHFGELPSQTLKRAR